MANEAIIALTTTGTTLTLNNPGTDTVWAYAAATNLVTATAVPVAVDLTVDQFTAQVNDLGIWAREISQRFIPASVSLTAYHVDIQRAGTDLRLTNTLAANSWVFTHRYNAQVNQRHVFLGIRPALSLTWTEFTFYMNTLGWFTSLYGKI